MIIDSGDPNLFPDLQIPRSTALGWIRHGISEVVTASSLEVPNSKLLVEFEEQKREIERLKATVDLSGFTFSLFGLQIQYRRLPHKDAKTLLLDAIEKAKKVLPLNKCLESIGLSAARFHNWRKRQVKCQLADNTSCPRLAPSKLTFMEIAKIKEFATSERFTHFSISALSWFAKKSGEVFASPSTWCRVIKQLEIKRPGKRLYPPKPQIGIRASGVNQIWHLDLTILRLTDRSRVFIQSIIDNFSRYVLATHVNEAYGGKFTHALLEEAVMTAKSFGHTATPNVFVDGGSENDNEEVNQLIITGEITRTIAQIEVDFSNSVAEAFFRRLKNAYLYLQRLTDFKTTKEKTLYYVKEHNEVMAHNHLKGATPLEVYSGQWNQASYQQLQKNHQQAMLDRRSLNQKFRCEVCPT